MRLFCSKILLSLLCFQLHFVSAQNPDIIHGKDYAQNFYLKASVGAGNTNWRLHFPENFQDTNIVPPLPVVNKLKFKGHGEERYLSFSALFGLSWGKFGGGFETSRLRIDSLREEVDGNEIRASYHKDYINFNRFFIEYESLRMNLNKQEDFFFVVDALAGTYILSPIGQGVVTNSNLFVMLGPQVEHELNRALSALFSMNYEFRYFNNKVVNGVSTLVYNNYLHSFNIRIGMKFRFYKGESKRQLPPSQRVR